MSKNPLFGGMPGGDTTVEIPDGVTKTEGCRAPNSLLNSGWAHGGFDGEGYGAFARDGESGMFAICVNRRDSRFRVG